MADFETKAIIQCNCGNKEDVKIEDIVIKNLAVSRFWQIADFYCPECTNKCQPAWVEFVLGEK
jgi:hypothetical protein